MPTIPLTRRETLPFIAQYAAVRCLKCSRRFGVPSWAVLEEGMRPERIRGHQENLMIWRDMKRAEHAVECMAVVTVVRVMTARERAVFVLGGV